MLAALSIVPLLAACLSSGPTSTVFDKEPQEWRPISSLSLAQAEAILGEEAYFHSDGSNFLFLLLRKGRAMIRLKVSKISKHSSEGELLRVSGSLADAP